MRLGIVFSVFAVGALFPMAGRSQPDNDQERPTKVTMARAQAAKTRENGAAQPASKAEASSAFQTFCEEWMEKLVVRERDNVSHIKWDARADGVRGEYVGYSHEHTCTVREDSTVPIGKVSYREVRYEKHGPTVADAERTPAQSLEITEVTEIFRYDKGKWVW